MFLALLCWTLFVQSRGCSVRTILPWAQVELPDLEQGVLAIGQQELLIFADLNIHDLIAVRGERHDLGRGSECGDRPRDDERDQSQFRLHSPHASLSH